MMFDFGPAKASGLTQSRELSRLFGVSRVTVCKWLSGGCPHTLIAPRVRRVLALLRAELEAGRLPLSEVDDRTAALERLIKKLFSVSK